jgi:hypothetical protein
MTWIFGRRCIAEILLAAGVADAAEWMAAEDRQGAVQVRLYDYAGVPAAVLEATKGQASEVFGRAGVQLDFVDCRLRPEDPPKNEACKSPASPLNLHLNILDLGMALSMARNTGRSRNCLGAALVTAGLPSRASVFFHRALELANSTGVSLAAILGAMMAHEIGHLLLKQGAHSAGGIMRAQWGTQELKSIAHGRLGFTADQASRLALMVLERHQEVRAKDNSSLLSVCSRDNVSPGLCTLEPEKQLSRKLRRQRSRGR